MFSKAFKHIKSGGLIGFLIVLLRYFFLENKLVCFLSKNPNFNRVYWKIYKTFFRGFILLLNQVYPNRYCGNNPFKVLWVNPSEIDLTCNYSQEKFVHSLRYGQLVQGEWDQKTRKIENTEEYHGLKKYLEGSRQNEYFLSSLEERENSWCTTLEEREEEVNKLLNSLRQNGYITQSKLFKKNPKDTIRKCNDSLFPHLNEIQVAISREGDLYWITNGKHRLILSKMLGIESIPVLVRFRHLKWQKKRKKAVKNPKKVQKHLNHPDIRYLLS